MQNFTFDKPPLCCKCNEVVKENGTVLQCSHAIHTKCVEDLILESHGEYISRIIIHKKYMLDFNLKDNEYAKIILGRKNDGIIKCPKCNKEYSIYRGMSHPKLICQKIIFGVGTNDVLRYDLCTNIDILHVLENHIQKKYFPKINYDNENEFNFEKSKINNKLHYYRNIKDDNVLHATLFNGKIKYYPRSLYPACKKIGKHATIDDYEKYCL